MRLPLAALAVGLLSLLAAEQSRAVDGAGKAEQRTSTVPAGALLYLDRAQWQRAEQTQRSALAADFMRIFCGDPAMPPSALVTCLDDDADSRSVFERALSCVSRRPIAKAVP